MLNGWAKNKKNISARSQGRPIEGSVPLYAPSQISRNEKYHKPLGEFLIRSLAQVVLVSNVAAKENRKSLDGRWDKWASQ
jgi:hypothetical protein